MGDWQLPSDARIVTVGADTAASRGTTISSSASANTKGAWVELSAAIGLQTDWVAVGIQRITTGGRDTLIDVGVGAAASEQVVLSNIYYSADNALSCVFLPFPLRIPSGSRVAVRCQAATGSTDVAVTLLLGQGGFGIVPGFSRITTYGANTADSGGVAVDPGATQHTKGAYGEITASTTYPIKWLGLRFGNQAVVTRGNASHLVDLAVGAAASEQIIVNNLPISGTTDEVVQPGGVWLPVSIPAGTRLACRGQSSSGTSTARVFDVIAYGAG